MFLRAVTLRGIAVALLLGWVLPAPAQEDTPKPSYSRLLDIDALIDSHARFLARRYNLSPEQDAFTQAFLRQKANVFLDKHREELYDLVDRLFEVRAGGEMSSQDLIAWGKRALPLYEEAKTLIIDGNNEWRSILTDEQRRTHDQDLREMHESFATTEDQLQRIVSGQMTLEEFRKGPGQQSTRRPMPSQANAPSSPSPQPQAIPAGEPVRPAAPPPTVSTPPVVKRGDSPGPKVSAHQPGVGTVTTRPTLRQVPGVARSSAGPASLDFESQWEAYVREFIQRYQLDEGQSQRATAILKDCQELARRQIQRRRPELERLDKKLLSLGQSKDGDKLKELTEINQRRTKLLEPINEIFEKQLKPRLERLPTRAQRQAAEEAGRHGPVNPGMPGRPVAQPPQRPQPPPPEPTPPPVPPPPPPENEPPPEESAPDNPGE